MTTKLDIEGIRVKHLKFQRLTDDEITDLLIEVNRLQSELEVVSVIDRYLGGGWTMQLANALLKAKDKDPLPEQTK